MKKPKVITIILNWNGKKDTLVCLKSLEQTDYPNHEVIVVDNASSDTSAKDIHQAFPEVHLIVNDKNLGFSGGNNVGINWALAHQADYCFVLNNDTTVEPTTIRRLIETAEADSSIGAVGPQILYMEPKGLIASLGGKIRWNKAEAIQGFHALPIDQAPAEPFVTQFLTAAAVLVRRDAMKKAGLLPDGYFYGMEDAAWCNRIVKAGFTLIAEPRARIFHKESASTGQTSPIKLYYASRNALLFLKYEGGNRSWYYTVLYHIKVIKQTLKWLFGRNWVNLKAFWAGYMAFWHGEEGPRRIPVKGAA